MEDAPNFLQIFRTSLLAERIISYIFDLQGLTSLQTIALKYCVPQGHWDPKLCDIIERKICNSTMNTWNIIGRHIVGFGHLWDEPCHICGKLMSFNDKHISLHLNGLDDNGARLSLMNIQQCPFCLSNQIQYMDPGFQRGGLL